MHKVTFLSQPACVWSFCSVVAVALAVAVAIATVALAVAAIAVAVTVAAIAVAISVTVAAITVAVDGVSTIAVAVAVAVSVVDWLWVVDGLRALDDALDDSGGRSACTSGRRIVNRWALVVDEDEWLSGGASATATRAAANGGAELHVDVSVRGLDANGAN